MSAISIRRANEADVDTIVRLVNAGGPENRARTALPEILPPAYFEAYRRIATDENQWLMVAEVDGQIIGTFHMTFITYLHAAGRPDCLLEAIHVRKEDRGKGYGSMILKWAIQAAQEKNCRRVQLTTDKRRAEAHRFYERLGFIFSHEGAKLPLPSL